MKKFILRSTLAMIVAGSFCTSVFTACSDDDFFKKEDIKVNLPQGDLVVKVSSLFNVTVESVSDEGLIYQWSIDDKVISNSKNLEYKFDVAGQYTLTLKVSKAEQSYVYEFPVNVIIDSKLDPAPDNATPLYNQSI